MLRELEQIDNEAEVRELSMDEWQHRYEIETKLEEVYRMEEIYWKQRVGDRWTLKGDANTEFFHHYANGRRRKNTTVSLESDQGEIQGQEDITKHIVEFYKNLFGPNPDRMLFLANTFWQGCHQVPEEYKIDLTRSFSEAEIREAIWDMKNESAPGPNGYGVTIFKRFWETIKGDYTRMFEDLHEECLDIKRLNYGVITLIPKIKEPTLLNNIDQSAFLMWTIKGSPKS